MESLSKYLVSLHQYLDRGDPLSREFRARQSFYAASRTYFDGRAGYGEVSSLWD